MNSMTSKHAIHAEGVWTYKYIVANSTRLRIADCGKGPLIILIHGFPFFSWTWRNYANTLVNAGYRIVMLDLRGFAGSDHTPQGYDPLNLSNDIKSLIQALGEKTAHLIGHDIGGEIAWVTASLHKKLIKGIISISSLHPNRRLLSLHLRLRLFLFHLMMNIPFYPEKKMLKNNSQYISEYLRQYSYDPSWLKNEIAIRYQKAIQHKNTRFCAAEIYRWKLRSRLRPDGVMFYRKLKHNGINVPVLNIYGINDKLIRKKHYEYSRRLVSAYTSCPINNAGHFPHEEAYEEVLDHILTWLTVNP